MPLSISAFLAHRQCPSVHLMSECISDSLSLLFTFLEHWRVGAGWGLSPGPEAVRDWEKGRDREQDKERGTRQEGNHLRVWGPGAWRLRCPPGRQGQGAGFGDGEAAGGLTAAASKRTSIL